MLSSSALPASRLFPAPKVPFDTEMAVVTAGNVAFEEIGGVTYVAAEDGPSHPRYALVRTTLAIDPVDAAHAMVTRLSWRSPGAAIPTQRVIVVEDGASVDAMAPVLADAGLRRERVTYFAVRTHELTRGGAQLELEALIGDEAWRLWASVEREIFSEADATLDGEATARFTEAQLDRSVQFKRKQQRESPPIRRYVARLPASQRSSSEPVAMIGYAPFGACDMGIGAPGPLARLRDVAVRAQHRRRGVGAALLRGLAARVIDECNATQLLIGGVAGPAAALYRKIGARAIDGCTMFSGYLG